MPEGAAKPADTPAVFPGLAAREIRWFREVDSTNLRLAELARRGGDEAENVVIVADHQTAGRGRRGRTWESPTGSSLLVSVLLRARMPELAQLTTVCAALAAASACERASGVRVSLKWPNDVMVGDRKLGGILAEALPGGIGVVVGLGLNVDWGEVALPEGATSLGQVAGAARIDRTSLLTSYLQGLDHRCDALDDPAEHQQLLDDYRRACSTLGRHVSVDLGAEQLVGTATGIAHNGSLILETDTGARELTTGDVAHIGNP